MTATPDYIKKCEMAEEIQAMRAPTNEQELADGYIAHFCFKGGDFFTDGELFTSGNFAIHVLGSLTSGPYIYHRHGVETLELPARELHDRSESVAKIIWLPRLDQLLDMLDGVDISLHEIAGIFTSDREEKLLDVIMRNKFGKKWDGEQWLAV